MLSGWRHIWRAGTKPMTVHLADMVTVSNGNCLHYNVKHGRGLVELAIPHS